MLSLAFNTIAIHRLWWPQISLRTENHQSSWPSSISYSQLLLDTFRWRLKVAKHIKQISEASIFIKYTMNPALKPLATLLISYLLICPWPSLKPKVYFEEVVLYSINGRMMRATMRTCTARYIVGDAKWCECFTKSFFRH